MSPIASDPTSTKPVPISFAALPVRLTAVVAAAPEAIDRVIESNESLRTLVENEWIDLFAWSPDRGSFLRRGMRGGEWIAWEEVR